MTARTLSAGELQRLRYELGANVVGIGAEPYIGHQRIFDVIQTNLLSDAQDPATCATSVTATGGVTLTLDSVSGLAAGARVVLDVDDEHEVVTVKRVSGLTISVNCQRLHTTPYPVELESGLTLVRCKLWQLAAKARQLEDVGANAGLKRVDEVEWETGRHGPHAQLRAEQRVLRLELASLVNLTEVLRSLGFARGGGVALY